MKASGCPPAVAGLLQSGCAHLAYPMVLAVCDVEDACRVDDAAMGAGESGAGGAAAITAIALAPTSHGGHGAGHYIDPANRVVLSVHHVDVAVAIAANALGTVERGFGSRAAVAAVAL